MDPFDFSISSLPQAPPMVTPAFLAHPVLNSQLVPVSLAPDHQALQDSQTHDHHPTLASQAQVIHHRPLSRAQAAHHPVLVSLAHLTRPARHSQAQSVQRAALASQVLQVHHQVPVIQVPVHSQAVHHLQAILDSQDLDQVDMMDQPVPMLHLFHHQAAHHTRLQVRLYSITFHDILET